MKKYVLLFFLLGIRFSLLAQEIGSPFLKHFLPKQYKGESQNWAICQASNGLLYVGNSSGLLEYDGTNWKLYKLPNKNYVRSMRWDKSKKKLYIGGQGEIGYFEMNSNGKLTYYSFFGLLDSASQKELTDVWSTQMLGDTIYFHGRDRLIRIYKEKVKIWKTADTYHRAFVLGGKLYLREKGRGLCVLQNDSLRLVPQGEIFKEDIISGMVALSTDVFLIGSRKQGLFYYFPRQNKIESINPREKDWEKINTWIQTNVLYYLDLLPNGQVIATTTQGGILIFDAKGNFIQNIDKTKGLPPEPAYFTFIDQHQSLWVGLDNGLARVEIQQAMSHYGTKDGLMGIVYSLYRFREALYAGTSMGLFVLRQGYWEQVEGIKAYAWTIVESPDQTMWIGTTDGLYEFKGEKAVPLGLMGNSIRKILVRKDSVYLGLRDGWAAAYRENENWVFKQKNKEFLTIRSLSSDENSLWLGSQQKGLYRVQDQKVTLYDTLSGLPTPHFNKGYFYHNQLLVATQKGFYRLKSDRFEPDLALNQLSQDHWIYTCRLDKKGNLWYLDRTAGNLKIITGFEKGNYQIDSLTPKRLPSLSSLEGEAIFSEENGITWIGGDEGLFRYDPTLQHENKQNDLCLLRKIKMGDSILFEGSAEKLNLELDHSKKALSFYFSAPYLIEEDRNTYACFLEGYDHAWSVWQTNTEWHYTNLPEGNYVFRVKARNIYGYESREVKCILTIFPPWYRTSWAFALYLIGIILLIYLLLKWNSRRLERERAHLEKMVWDRTDKIVQQKNDLQKAYKNIQSLGEIGQKITSSLNVSYIVNLAYYEVSKIMETNVFIVGLYEADREAIKIYTLEEKEEVPPFYYYLSEKERPAIWCFENQKEIFMNDSKTEWHKYFGSKQPEPKTGKLTTALIYLPLWRNEKVVGVLSVQSFKKDVYSEQNLDFLKNIAIYTAIALENSQLVENVRRTNEDLQVINEELHQNQEEILSQRDLLAQKNETLEIFSNKITQSIHSARLIQNAVLPSINRMESVFADYFVLYLPKDIVSGDFWWADSFDDYRFLIVTDCTGHGVPGAFMTMIGNSLLDRVIRTDKITEPKDILNELNLQIKILLQQEQTGNTDGMDIAVLRISPNKVSFAGAKRPLHISQNGKIEKIVGSRMSIGGRQNHKKEFEQTDFKKKEEAIFYLCSDGYADQNNRERKNFSERKFMDLLDEIQDFSLAEQRKKLKYTIKIYMEGTEQRDDILVVGLRI